MKILVNGQKMQLTEQINLKKAIEKFCPNPEYTIAELNGAIIKSPQWGSHTLNEGDVLELVNFVGGG